MTRTIYVGVDYVSELQQEILLYIKWWIKMNNTPVPQKAIIIEMKKKKYKDFTVANALSVLRNRGYIRKGVNNSSINTTYVQIRTI